MDDKKKIILAIVVLVLLGLIIFIAIRPSEPVVEPVVPEMEFYPEEEFIFPEMEPALPEEEFIFPEEATSGEELLAPEEFIFPGEEPELEPEM
ncbi:MAG: hypothetical protein PHV25_01640 [Candidatus Pacebacteria bacterium]|nr:hypothetical protein [Candidatus Paceibacterota bacterium]